MDAADLRLIQALKIALGKRLNAATLQEVANECRASPGQLSRFLRGERMLKLDTAARLFDALGLHIVARRRKAA